MSHLEKDILKGKFGNNPQLKKEAREETAEEKIEKKTGKKVKVREGNIAGIDFGTGIKKFYDSADAFIKKQKMAGKMKQYRKTKDYNQEKFRAGLDTEPLKEI